MKDGFNVSLRSDPTRGSLIRLNHKLSFLYKSVGIRPRQRQSCAKKYISETETSLVHHLPTLYLLLIKNRDLRGSDTSSNHRGQ